MGYQTYYKVTNKNDDVLIDCSPSKSSYVCFAHYTSTYKPIFNGENILHVYFLKEYSDAAKPSYECGPCAENIFSKDQVLDFIGVLNQASFKMDVEEHEKYYTFVLRESDYINHTHVRIALDFLRLLWEGYLNKILKAFFEIPKEVREKYSNFKLLQVLSMTVGYSGGACHYLPSNQYVPTKFSVLSVDEMIEGLKSKQTFSGTFDFWTKLSAAKFAEYQKKVPKAKQAIKPEKKEELSKLVLDSNKSVYRAYQICNPVPLADIEAAKESKPEEELVAA